MTLRLRNYVLWTIVLLALIITAASSWQWANMLYGDPALVRAQPLLTQRWLFFGWNWSDHNWAGQNIEWVLYGLLIQTIVALLGLLILVRLFRQIISAHVLLFAIVLFGIVLQSARIFQPALAPGESRLIGSLITRISYFGHLISVFGLLGVSLFLSGSDYRRLGLAIGVSSFMSLVIVYSLPIDDFSLLPNLTLMIGRSITVQITTVVIDVLALLNAIYVGVAHQRISDYTLYGISIAAIVVGRQLLFYMPLPVAIVVGLAVLAGGGALFVAKSYSTQLWE